LLIGETKRPALLRAWLAVVGWLGLIALESTESMSAAHTGGWLLKLLHALWGQTDTAGFEMAHFLLRKLGHLCGYGILSILFFRAWFLSLRGVWRSTMRSLRSEAAKLAMTCTFLVACMDEWHQSFLPGRTSSFRDVLIDTLGAVLFTTLFTVWFARQRESRVRNAIVCPSSVERGQ
jgi:VanZ family protein